MQAPHLRFLSILLSAFLMLHSLAVRAEDYEEEEEEIKSTVDSEAPSRPSRTKKEEKKRKYMVPDPNRVDAGVFHVAFAVGGNFYIEPEVAVATKTPTGNYFKDFGFQGGVYFDYDYSELPQNIPLALRGMVGYKNVHGGTHVFAFDGVVRWMFRFSEKATFGISYGGSVAVWVRPLSTTPPVSNEETVFLPSLIVGAGFEFNPFMVDFKALFNKVGENSTRMGLELYFGFRL